MKIGLIRHCKVNHPRPAKWLVSGAEVAKWFAAYDLCTDLHAPNCSLEGQSWRHCYCSTLKRAMNTAHQLYAGEVVQDARLCELSFAAQLPVNAKWPFVFWAIWLRVLASISSPNTNEFKQRVRSFVNDLLAQKHTDVLIVSHWFVMVLLVKELKNRGFVGPAPSPHEYATLYVYHLAEPQKGSVDSVD